MKSKSPIWYINTPCPCCGQGYPALVICPSCGWLTVHCEETSRTFPDRKIALDTILEKCPLCHAPIDLFTPASSEQLREAGFTKEDYQ